MQSNHETMEGEMSEQLAVESIEHGGCWYDAVNKRWHYGDESKRDGDDQIVCFDPESGDRLNADGTVTQMVPAVTSDEVRGTRLHELLLEFAGGPVDDDMMRGFLGLVDETELITVETLDADSPWVITDDGRTILHALQQVGTWERVAKWLADTLAVNCKYKFHSDVPSHDEWQASWWLRAALSAVGATGPSDGELMDVLDDVPQIWEVRSRQSHACYIRGDKPVRDKLEVVGTMRDLARAILAQKEQTNADRS